MERISVPKDLLEKEEMHRSTSHSGGIDDDHGFKGVPLPPPPPPRQDEDPILWEIHHKYLEARSPLQMKQLQTIFLEESETGRDLDPSGSKPNQDEKVYEEIADCERDCPPSSFTSKNPNLEILRRDRNVLRLKGLYNVTIGWSPSSPTPCLLPNEMAMERGVGTAAGKLSEKTFIQPPIQYRIAFAKYIIKKIESSSTLLSGPSGSHEESGMAGGGDELEETLEKWYSGLESICNSGQPLSERFYRLYKIKTGCQSDSGRQSRLVKIFEHENSFVADGTTGLVTWKASIEFVNWLTSQGEGEHFLAERFSEKRVKWVLELGCGCGYLAVALASCIPGGTLEQYIATDGSLAALEAAKENVQVNFEHNDEIKKRIRFEKVDWQNEQTQEGFIQLVDGLTAIHGPGTGLLIGADVVFDPAIIPDLVGLIKEFIDEAQAGTAILSCTVRNEETMGRLKEQFDMKLLKVKTCGTWEDGEILEINK